MLSQILTAVALLLVLEGIFPFISPERYKRAMNEVSKISDQNLRTVGLVVMLIGVVLLYLTNR